MYSTDGNGKKYYAARDGQTLTGNFGGYEGYITIADGATVTLNLEGFLAPDQCDHAPIHCLPCWAQPTAPVSNLTASSLAIPPGRHAVSP